MATAPAFVFDETAHAYRTETGVAFPSVTQALKAEGFISFDGIPWHILERKRQLGSLVHRVTELYDRGENLDDYDIPADVWPYLQGYENFRTDTDFVPELIEQRMLGQVYQMWYGMTPDRTGPIDGVKHILELKCGASEHPAWGLQLAAYDIGLNERPTLPRVALQLGPQFARNYKLHTYPEKTDYQIWASCLANTIWKMNKGIFVLEDVPERVELGG